MTTALKAKQKSYKQPCSKWTYGLSGNDYRVATVSKAYLIKTVMNMQSFKLIGKCVSGVQTYGSTLIIEKFHITI